MANLQITCINRMPRDNPHEGITRLGGAGWKKSREQVVNEIETNQNTFYISVGGIVVDVAIATGARGKYVRARLNNVWNDQLLALPQCF